MYLPNYGYGAANNAQPYSGPSNVHPPGQQPQQMMYNPQQYGQQQPSPYGASMAGVNHGAGGLGIMQNSGMTQMGGGNGPSYQTPYSTSPYGPGMPASSVSLPPNYLAAQGNPPGFGMNPNMMSQRMQPPPTSTPGPGPTARQSPYGIPHGSPPNASNPQFAQNPQMRAPTPASNPQVTSGGTVTPQTPNFPPNAQGQASNLATPLSPRSEGREKERVTLLLDINRELLQEVVHLQAVQAETKKREEGQAEPKEGAKDGEGDKTDADKAEKDKVARAYVDCMRRLQVNLAYLAAIADRPNKPASQVPSHPAIMTAPSLSPRSPKMSKMSSPSAEGKKGEAQSPASEEDRPKILKDQYDNLLALFPGVDPKKDATLQQPNAAARAQAQLQAAQLHKQQGAGGQGNGTLLGNGTINAEQQRIQNEMMRQRMVQQQQAQQQQQQRAMVGQGR